jgi:hypothetical protein
MVLLLRQFRNFQGERNWGEALSVGLCEASFGGQCLYYLRKPFDAGTLVDVSSNNAAYVESDWVPGNFLLLNEGSVYQ